MRLLLLLPLVLVLAAPCAAQRAAQAPSGGSAGALGADPLSTLAAFADTSAAAHQAALRIEAARLGVARHDLRAAGWRRLRPRIDMFMSVSTRGLAFPSISSQGYDPAYAAIARWPGDTWGLTASWSLDQLLDRTPLHRARAAVDVAEARIELQRARHQQQRAAKRERRIAEAQRQAREDRAAQLVAHQLRTEATFLARRAGAQAELLRLAEMKYEAGELDYEALARQRLTLLAAEHAEATNAARLAALTAGGLEALVLLTTDHAPRGPLAE